MLRLVVVSNGMASAFRSRSGASFALIELVRRKWIRTLATPPLFLESEDVLKRPEQRAVSRLSLLEQYHPDRNRLMTVRVMKLLEKTNLEQFHPR